MICALFTITALSCTQDGGNNTTDTEKASDDGKETTKNATYTVTIDSIEHGIVMASKTSEIEEGETITLTVTATDGYELSSLSIKDSSGTSISTKQDSNNSTKYIFTMPKSNVTVSAEFTAVSSGGAAYTVLHLQQNVDDDQYTQVDSEILYGSIGEQTLATAKTYEGFMALAITQTAITEDGNATVEIKYDRNVYSVSYADGVENEEISVPSTAQYRYGKTVSVDFIVGTRSAYTFTGFFDGTTLYTSNGKTTLIMGASSVILTAQWESNGNGNTSDNTKTYNEPTTKTIGNGNYFLHNFVGENTEFPAETIEEDAGHYYGEAGTYVKGLANAWNESMADRPAAQNYFANLIDSINENNYFDMAVTNPKGTSFDVAVTLVSGNAEKYFKDIVKNLDSGYNNLFYYCYRILANESFKEGLGTYREGNSSEMDAYNNEKEAIQKEFPFLFDYDKEYGENNFSQTTQYMDELLDMAVNSMNNNHGVNMKVEDLRQLINLTMTTESMAAMHQLTKNNLQETSCGMALGIDVAMENAITAAKNAQQSQGQTMGL